MFIPTSDENDDHETPVVTLCIIALCTLLYVLQWHVSGDGFGIERAFGFVSGDYMPGYAAAPRYLKLWMILKTFFNPLGTGWVRVISSTFLHANFFHLAGNMLFLFVFGDNVEHAMGKARYLGFFLLTGFLAEFVQTLFGGAVDVPTIGASGAIAGVMGAYLLYYPNAILNVSYGGLRTGNTVRVKARYYLIFFFLDQVMSGFATWGAKYVAVAFWAHIGGYVFGYLLAFVFKDPEVIFKAEADKLFGMDAAPLTHGETHEKTFGGYKPAQRIHKRPSLSEMRNKGREEAKRRKERGIDWSKDP